MKQKLKLKKILWIIFILLLWFQYGCNKNKNKYQAYLDMKEFVLDNHKRSNGYYLFFQTPAKNKITYVNTNDLKYKIYTLSENNEIEKESYFKDIMTGKIILTCGGFWDCFEIASNIKKEYKKKNFEEFLRNYTTYDDKLDRYFINLDYTKEELLSIVYYLYLHNMYTEIDDYTGYYISYKDLSPRYVDIDWPGFEETEDEDD